MMEMVKRYGRTIQGKRREITLSKDDASKIRRGRWTAIVTDQDTGELVKLKGASCGAPHCMCDMIILPYK